MWQLPTQHLRRRRARKTTAAEAVWQPPHGPRLCSQVLARRGEAQKHSVNNSELNSAILPRSDPSCDSSESEGEDECGRRSGGGRRLGEGWQSGDV